MYSPLSILFFLSTLLALFIFPACESSSEDSAKTVAERFVFPDDWEGDWKGTLNIWRPGGDTASTYPMELLVHPFPDSNRWTWVIVYGEGKSRSPREYELVEIDAKKGIYQIDEKNGIYLNGYHIENAFRGQFSVMGSMITDAYERVGEDLIFTIISSKLDAPIASGDTILVDGDTIPPVFAYPIQVAQKAVLRRNP